MKAGRVKYLVLTLRMVEDSLQKSRRLLTFTLLQSDVSSFSRSASSSESKHVKSESSLRSPSRECASCRIGYIWCVNKGMQEGKGIRTLDVEATLERCAVRSRLVEATLSTEGSVLSRVIRSDSEWKSRSVPAEGGSSVWPSMRVISDEWSSIAAVLSELPTTLEGEQVTYRHHRNASFFFLGVGLNLNANFGVMFGLFLIRKFHDNVGVKMTSFRFPSGPRETGIWDELRKFALRIT